MYAETERATLLSLCVPQIYQVSGTWHLYATFGTAVTVRTEYYRVQVSTSFHVLQTTVTAVWYRSGVSRRHTDPQHCAEPCSLDTTILTYSRLTALP